MAANQASSTELDRPDPPVRGAHVRRAGPLTVRLVIALALFPIVPAGGMISAEGIAGLAQAGKLPLFLQETFQIWMFLTTAVVTIVSLGIWRRAVAWTGGRRASTAITSMVPLVQVIWWQPLWAAGCFSEDILRLGQSTALIGLWVWAAVWIWWGWTRATPLIRGKLAMTDSAKRVLLSFGTIPVVVGGYVITQVFLQEANPFNPPNDERKAIICGNVIWVLAACAAWLRVWRPAILWSPVMLTRTVLAALVFLSVGIAAPFLPDVPSWAGAARFMLPVMAWGGWMIATVWMWPFQAHATLAVEDRLRCGACGYSLCGLYATRCPECGDQPTLDELMASITGDNDLRCIAGD